MKKHVFLVVLTVLTFALGSCKKGDDESSVPQEQKDLLGGFKTDYESALQEYREQWTYAATAEDSAIRSELDAKTEDLLDQSLAGIASDYQKKYAEGNEAEFEFNVGAPEDTTYGAFASEMAGFWESYREDYRTTSDREAALDAFSSDAFESFRDNVIDVNVEKIKNSFKK